MLELKITTDTNDTLELATIEAALEAALPVILKARDNLNPHDRTGDDLTPSEQARRDVRGPLRDSLVAEVVEHDSKVVIVDVGPNEANDELGAYFEYGTETNPDINWLSDAAREAGAQVIDTFARHLSKELRK